MNENDSVITEADMWRLVDRQRATAAAMVEDKDHCASAWSAAGLAVELALKATIMRRRRLNAWPDAGDLHSHNIRFLMREAGIDPRQAPPPPRHMLRMVMDWKREHDYRPGRMARKVARSMVESALSKEGVVEWLRAL